MNIHTHASTNTFLKLCVRVHSYLIAASNFITWKCSSNPHHPFTHTHARMQAHAPSKLPYHPPTHTHTHTRTHTRMHAHHTNAHTLHTTHIQLATSQWTSAQGSSTLLAIPSHTNTTKTASGSYTHGLSITSKLPYLTLTPSIQIGAQRTFWS